MNTAIRVEIDKEGFEKFSKHLNIKINNSISFVLENFPEESVEKKTELIVKDLSQRGFNIDKSLIEPVVIKNS